MRHRVKGKKLGRTKSHKLATMRSLALAIIEHKEIKTTLAKAKEARRYIERLITYSKKDTVHARRLAYKFLNKHKAVKVLFDEIGPTFEGRNGGYTRIVKLGQREGDGAELAILQLVGFEKSPIVTEAPQKKKKAKKKVEEAPKETEAPEMNEESQIQEEEIKEETKEAAEKEEQKKTEKASKKKEETTEKTEEKAAKEVVKEEKKEQKPDKKEAKEATPEEKVETEKKEPEEKKEDTSEESKKSE
jgi:large subunit ribosomal protein L17